MADFASAVTADLDQHEIQHRIVAASDKADAFRRWRWEQTHALRDRGAAYALTIFPEYVWAIMFLDKDREYRSYHPPKALIGSRLAIQAGAYIGGRKGMQARSEGLESLTRMARRAGWTVDALGGPEKTTLTFTKGDRSVVMVPDEILTGAIVATALVSDVTTDPSEPWSADYYGWKLADLEVLPTPIPCKGIPGLWWTVNAGGPVPCV